MTRTFLSSFLLKEGENLHPLIGSDATSLLVAASWNNGRMGVLSGERKRVSKIRERARFRAGRTHGPGVLRKTPGGLFVTHHTCHNVTPLWDHRVAPSSLPLKFLRNNNYTNPFRIHCFSPNIYIKVAGVTN